MGNHIRTDFNMFTYSRLLNKYNAIFKADLPTYVIAYCDPLKIK
jgi:hypothetical protein